MQGFTTIDLIILLVYLAAVLFAGLHVIIATVAFYGRILNVKGTSKTKQYEISQEAFISHVCTYAGTSYGSTGRKDYQEKSGDRPILKRDAVCKGIIL